jgi:hypothetical protein
MTESFLKSGSSELHRTCWLDATRASYYTRTAILIGPEGSAPPTSGPKPDVLLLYYGPSTT